MSGLASPYKLFAIAILVVLLVVLFYFIDAQELLDKLGQATLATLSFVELIEIVLEKVATARAKGRETNVQR